MSWQSVGKELADMGLKGLGAAVAGPAGMAVAGQVAKALGLENATPDAVSAALKTDPQAAVKLRQIEADVQEKQIGADVQDVQAVNATMQAESRSEHWAQWLWRPLVGFAVAFDVWAAGVVVLMTFGPAFVGHAISASAVKALPAVLGALVGLVAASMPVLGVASWGRNKLKAIRASFGNG